MPAGCVEVSVKDALTKAETVALFHAVQAFKEFVADWKHESRFDEKETAQCKKYEKHLSNAKRAMRKINELRGQGL